MDPLNQSVPLTKVIFFFVSAIGVIAVAVVAIADDEGRHLAWQTAAKRDVIGSPDLVNALLQVMRRRAIAIGVDVVGGVADFNRGSGKAVLCAAWRQRHIRVAAKLFESVGIVPGVFSDPQVDVLVVVELNVPRIAIATLGPEELVPPYGAVKGIGSTG